MHKEKLFLRWAACLFFWGGILHAQVTTGTILGSVTDSSGALIPGAKITVKSTDTGISRTVNTDAAGR